MILSGNRYTNQNLPLMRTSLAFQQSKPNFLTKNVIKVLKRWFYFLLTSIWLSHSQLWAIIEGTLYLLTEDKVKAIYCNGLIYRNYVSSQTSSQISSFFQSPDSLIWIHSELSITNYACSNSSIDQ